MYRDRPSYSGFSNFFRYKLLLERGGWWVDSDTVCLRPFDFAEDYVFSSQKEPEGEVANVGALKAPAGSEAMAYAWGVCQAKNKTELVWGEVGPKLIAHVVNKYDLERHRKPSYVFCPVSWADWHKLLEPYAVGIPEEAYAVHLWNEMWRLNNQDKESTYHPACIYEQLKTKYLANSRVYAAS
jgi:mannosyltransferase OCH1-like enzyme